MFRRWMAYERPKGQISNTVLVLVAPYLVLWAIALLSGGDGDLGTPELTLIELVHVVGLTWIWVAPLVRHLVRPRQRSQDSGVTRPGVTDLTNPQGRS